MYLSAFYLIPKNKKKFGHVANVVHGLNRKTSKLNNFELTVLN